MNALFVLRPAKLWAFNIGHPCPSLAKGELNVVVLRPNFQLISNQSCTIVQSRPFPYPAKIRNVIIGRNLLRLTAARSEQSAATRHKTCIAPSLNPDRFTIHQKSATLLKVGTIRLHFRPPSTQLKPISIFLKGEFEAAHSRKVGICSGSQPTYSCSAKL